MIVPMTPYCPSDSPPPHGKNLGYAYRECMDRLRDDDWALFMDHDISWVTPDWYPLLEAGIEQVPDAGVIGPVQYDPYVPHQNSTGSPDWKAPIEAHGAHGREVADRHGAEVIDVTEWIYGDGEHRSIMVGFAMLISKRAWCEVGLDGESLWARRDIWLSMLKQGPQDLWPDNPGVAAVCGNDTFITRVMAQAGKRFYVMPGVYAYHSKMFWLDDHAKHDTDWTVKARPVMQ